jgi:inosine/xanthosine triphosphate pyrophosphatase family protein
MSRTRTIVLASRNPDKLRELREICAGGPFEVVAADTFPGLPEVIEDGTSVRGNATRKALVTAAYTGEIAVADDTAFQIRTLGGLPDIFASRFAGPQASYADNVALTLELMREVPEGSRDARFETSVVWIDPRPGRLDAAAVVPPADARWLHNPWARSIALGPHEDADSFWNELGDRRLAWEQYDAWMRTLPVAWGADTERVVALADELIAPYRGGGRPAGADPAAVRVPDTRIWTVAGPDDAPPPPTLVAPAGLPADAPGRATAAPVWFELAAEGRLLGHLAGQPLGGGGFGYDPIFVPEGHHRTLAELDPAEKNAISHRARALKRVLGAASRLYDGS